MRCAFRYTTLVGSVLYYSCTSCSVLQLYERCLQKYLKTAVLPVVILFVKEKKSLVRFKVVTSAL